MHMGTTQIQLSTIVLSAYCLMSTVIHTFYTALAGLVGECTELDCETYHHGEFDDGVSINIAPNSLLCLLIVRALLLVEGDYPLGPVLVLPVHLRTVVHIDCLHIISRTI